MLCWNHEVLRIEQPVAIPQLFLCAKRPCTLYGQQGAPYHYRHAFWNLHVSPSLNTVQGCPRTSLLRLSISYRLRGYEIPVYEDGTGACSGAPYNLTGLSPTAVYTVTRSLPQKSLRLWLKDLRKDGLILTSFIFGLIGGKSAYLK